MGDPIFYFEDFLSCLDYIVKWPFNKFAKFLIPRKQESSLPGKIWAAPNIVSFLRIPLGLTFLVFIAYEMPAWAILATHASAAITDALDGALAKRVGVTKLGAIIDPLCDKFYVGLCAIAYYSVISDYIFWPLFGLELFLALTPFVVIIFKIRRGGAGAETDFRANIFGKMKFFLELVAIVFFTFGFVLTANSILFLALVFAVLSIVGRLIKEIKKNGAAQ